MTSSKINQLQLLQQNLQQVVNQKQQFQSQMIELDSALQELETTDKAYKIVGKIMVASPKNKLVQELNEKKEVVEVRINNFEKQELKLKESLEKAQAEVMKEFKEEKK
ncbi:prefoldin subunit beta [Candidatus Woesearchaeota archaeon]|nr:prefoldin subunit beta [Candidatus Woesearchaeota archaeon]